MDVFDMDEAFWEELGYLCVPTLLEYSRKTPLFPPSCALLKNRFKTTPIVSIREFAAWYGISKFFYIYLCTLYLANSIFYRYAVQYDL